MVPSYAPTSPKPLRQYDKKESGTARLRITN
jgi:hypothetical protein